MPEVKIGMTDYTTTIFIPDPASSVGKGKTGLTAAAITVSYTRVETDNDVTVADVTSSMNDLSALTDAHADWGWKEVSATLAPGLYRIDIADAVFASGAWSAVVQVQITSGLAAASPKEFTLTPQNPYDGVLLAPTTHTSAVIPTVSTLTGHTPQTGDTYALANGANGFVALKSDTAAILVDTGTTLDGRIPAALTGDGNMKVDVLRVNGSATAAANLALSAAAMVTGTVDSGATTTSIPTSVMSPSPSQDDQFVGRIVIFLRGTTTGELEAQATDITSSTSAGVLTVTALTDAPAAGDLFIIV